MNKKFLIKSIVLYVIITMIICKIKPKCLYNTYNNQLKPWYQYSITNDINDIITSASCMIFSAILSIYISSIV